MYTTEEIKQLVQQNIHQIKISEFVGEGGWPNIDNIDVAVFNQFTDKEITTVSLHILYTVDTAGCCFIPGAEQQKRMLKTVIINNNSVKFN